MKGRVIEYISRPQCLLVGNGINLLFGDQSWKDLIKEEINRSNTDLSYEEIKEMPATMQIVVATNDSVDQRLKDLSNKLAKQELSKDRISFLNSLLRLPVSDILTTNYSFELEVSAGMKPEKKQYSSKLTSTFYLQAKHRKFRLYQYYETMGKRIWHVHGDLAKPDTMLMGHYYYAKQLRAVQDCVPHTIRRFKMVHEDNNPFVSYSWVDQFLVGDIYILGLGMYLCESDLWYLLCCKKRNFPNTKVYYYDMNCDDTHICNMLKAYGAEIITADDLQSGNEYSDFYQAALKNIEMKIGSSGFIA